MKLLTSSFVVGLLASISAHGYEIDTHGAMTNEAYNASVLNNRSLLRVYGIDDTLPSPFGESYFIDQGATGLH